MSVTAKQITSIVVQLVTLESNRAYVDVISALDEEINKADSPAALMFLKGGKTTNEIVDKFTETLGDRDFIHFMSLPHGKWVNGYFGLDNAIPAASMYIFGNPMIAAGIMRYDVRAGLNIPPRLLVMEKEDRSGTRVIYHLPSSIMVMGEDAEQKTAAEGLDKNVEKLVVKILTCT